MQLSELELKLLADNNSFRKSVEQKPLVVKLFWSVLKDSDKYNTKLVQAAITHFDRFWKTDISKSEVMELLEDFNKELSNQTNRTPIASYTILFCNLFDKI